jgi:hypothetical protein
MRRLFITIVISLLSASLFGNNGISNPRQLKLKKKVHFTVIETPAVFTGSIDDKDYLIFIEHSDSLLVTGHYMSLEETMADTLPFRLEARGRRARLYYNGEKETFRPHVKTMDKWQADGSARLNVLKTALFHFQIHEMPVFQNFENKRYQDTLFSVEEINNICYANVPGFWSELGNETDVTDKIFRMTDAISEIPLKLHLDIFQPQNDTLAKHPLVMLVHGGAFYFGSKDDASITNWCRHLASQGYVTASIDYRIGFLPTMTSIGRAGYRAVQDAHAAMRYLVSHQEEYRIDTSMIFVGGASAGAITVLNLAFMTNETRPKYTRSDLLRPDLGDLDTCGNALKTNFRIKGIIDMWGAMPDTSFLHGRNIPILAFHGDADNIVPYGYDYPFGIAGPLKTWLVEPMFGSSCIIDRAIKLGHQAHLVTFGGYKHSPHVNPETKAFNDNFFLIQDMMSDFFYDIVVPKKLEIVGEDGHYYVRPYPLETSWQVEGGVILSSENNTVEVAWIHNTPQRSITASVLLPYGVGLTETRVIQ